MSKNTVFHMSLKSALKNIGKTLWVIYFCLVNFRKQNLLKLN